MGINLRGRQVLVAEQLLDPANIRTRIQQVSSERVSQRMGSRGRIQPCQLKVFRQNPTDTSHRQGRAVLVQEDRFAAAAQVCQQLLSPRKPGLDRLDRRRTKHRKSFPFAFAAHCQNPFLEIDVAEFQAAQFRPRKPAEYRVSRIALSRRPVRRRFRRGQQSIELALRQSLGSFLYWRGPRKP